MRKLLSFLLAVALCVGTVSRAFASESDYFIANKGTVLGEYSGPGGDITAPSGPRETVQTYQGNSEIRSVTIPSGYTKIGMGTFSNCIALERVTLPTGIKEIANGAFSGCTALKELIIPDSVETIGSSAFYGCTSLERIVLPANLRTVSFMLFQECTSLQEVVLPDSVKVIEGQAFYGCGALERITISKSLEEIQGNFSFKDCASLTGLVFPDSVKAFGYHPFDGCTSMNEVQVGSRIVPIGDGEEKTYAYLGAAKNDTEEFVLDGTVLVKYTGQKTDLIVPEGITEIGSEAFLDHSELVTLTLPEGIKKIGYHAFENCTSLRSLNLPSTLEELEFGAFMDCWALESIQIPKGVKDLPDQLFMRCKSLKELSIPEGVVSMGSDVFWGCASLTEIVFPTTLKYYSGLDEFSVNGVKTDGTLAQVPLKFYSTNFRQCSSLRRIVNEPHQELTERLKHNLSFYDMWVNPGQHLKEQSQAITALAEQITQGINTPYEKAKALSTWICENIKYDWDYYQGKKSLVAISPEEVLKAKLTVCDGYARLTSALLQAAGIPAIYVKGSAEGYTTGPHAWTEAYIDGRWIIMDNTWGMLYFDAGLVSMSCDHVYNYRPSASGDDIPSQWAQEEVGAALAAALIPDALQSGYQKNITREEFCRLMVVLVEQYTGQSIDKYLAAKGLATRDPFADTDSLYVLNAHALGIVNGTSSTTFTPAGSITRQEAATMLARTAKLLGLSGEKGETFTDQGSFAAWAADSIVFVSGLTDRESGNKVLGGTGNGTFSPAQTYSREQAYITALRLLHAK